MKVCIIGAGASGLVMCHRLLTCPSYKYDDITVYEQAKEIGGTWIYTEEIGTDQHGYPIHSSMYDNLQTNLPKELMAYFDFPFVDDGSPSYVTRQQVLQYLCDYSHHFKLLPYIKFEHRVLGVQPVENDTKWKIQVENIQNKQLLVNVFDRIIICNGHYATPRYPKIDGIEKFEGEIVHSHNYRVPDKYKGKNVLCIGAGSSGVDIVLDVAPLANQVVLSHDLPKQLESPWPENVQVRPWIKEVTPNGFTFKNGQHFQTDVLIVCTGYEYYFPFLNVDCDVEVKDHRVVELYKHMINIRYPTMAFVNVPFTTVPFVVGDVQAQCLAKCLGDLDSLPTTEEMLRDTKDELWDKLKRGIPQRHFHKFSFKIWDYLYSLETTFGGIPQPLPKWKQMMHEISFSNRSVNFMTFRHLSYKVRDNCVFYR
ncbi:flavin-dependent monooxygenas [Chamberlinius hualienensis]